AESACTFSPTTVKGSGTTVMTLTTTAPKSSGINPAVRIQFWASGGVGIAGIFLLSIPARQRRWRKVLGTILLFLAVAGCGGGSSSPGPAVQHDPGTTTGTYSANVVATSGALVHKVPFELVIQ
ncbi:MAG TPA: hypothetical protein VMT53_21555, partial [Terriglobales bacterium]|nr:hypothetical protein [Terriglobales bacterium]